VRDAITRTIITLPEELRRCPGIRSPKWLSTIALGSMQVSRSTSATRKAHGSAGPMRTPMATASVLPERHRLEHSYRRWRRCFAS
jgi:hypothetical protein